MDFFLLAIWGGVFEIAPSFQSFTFVNLREQICLLLGLWARSIKQIFFFELSIVFFINQLLIFFLRKH